MDDSVHRCPLPPPGVEFASAAGKQLFREALADGNMEGFFELSQHFLTQDNTGFCGIGSLTMALNTLLVDPKQVYSGMFRWYSQSMLNCCASLELASKAGTSMDTLLRLARCNGTDCTMVLGSEADLETLRDEVKRTCSRPAGKEPTVLIVSYSREALGQLGVGHFSPIGGYHASTDQVLIMDVARFKYPPHWLPLRSVFEAMKPVDLETGRSRGYLVLTKSAEPVPNHV